ncbi:hypothetical protein M407DRAFT_23491 [Tulasnella calospora MUT 4182]|uniref:Uncharacterized protein n=1 Tax=Tulasnella calospora MUT 4182 TaxID=1051891 RepID=A0A0C3M0Y5_9AGAM|nr:hypothetical protein M407DRAFT_23491 [Tulasnella calospora MUT 4182]
MFDKSPTANLIEPEDSEYQLLLIDRKETTVTETRTGVPSASSSETLSQLQVPPSHSSGVRAGDTSASLMENAGHLSSTSYENTLHSDVIALQTERSQLLAKAEIRSQSVESILAMLLAEPSIKIPPNTVFWIRLIRSR